MPYTLQDLYDELTTLDYKRGLIPKKKYIVIHHSLSPDTQTRNWDAIRKYHMSWRYNGNEITEDETKKLIAQGKIVNSPDTDIAYSFGIEEVNGKLEFRRGNDLAVLPAQAVGFNTNGFGICVVGDYDKEPMSKDKWDSLVQLCQFIRKIWYEKTGVNLKVIGHRETFTMRGKPVEKSCPGNMVNLDQLRTDIYGV
jgi:hypothetical protein